MRQRLQATRQYVLKLVTGAHRAIRKSWTDSLAAAPPELRKKAKHVITIAIGLLVLVEGYKFFSFKLEERRRAAEIAAGPRVRTTKVTRGLGEHQLTLIGETRPFESATLYAKVSGYLKKVSVDKGDIVKQGQLLALIESPETDEAFLAAEADSKNKSSILARMATLHEKNLISQQEFDQALADSEVASARLRSEQTIKGYESIRAPFDGTITARYADPGALVQNATSSESSALPVVTISQVKRLRVDVFLDQRDAPFVAKDEPVEITLAERPGFKLEGHVARLSGELDSRTKMLLTEIDIPNDDKSLLAGSFVQVSLRVNSPPYLECPVEGLTLRQEKPFLTVINSDNTLTYKPIEIAANDGKTLRIISGVKEGDAVALNVGNSMPEGGKLRPISDAPAPTGAK